MSIPIKLSMYKIKGGYFLRNPKCLPHTMHRDTCCKALSGCISENVVMVNANLNVYQELTMNAKVENSELGTWILQLIPSPYCQLSTHQQQHGRPKLHILIEALLQPNDPILVFTKAGLATPCIISADISKLRFSMLWDCSSCPHGGCNVCQTAFLQLFYQHPNLERSKIIVYSLRMGK